MRRSQFNRAGDKRQFTQIHSAHWQGGDSHGVSCLHQQEHHRPPPRGQTREQDGSGAPTPTRSSSPASALSESQVLYGPVRDPNGIPGSDELHIFLTGY